jgi:WD40 repeat protein
VWDAATGKELLTLGDQVALSVVWRPDGKRLATGTIDGPAKVWDAGTGKELPSLSGHSGSVFSMAWSPDGKRLAAGGEDTTIRVWNTGTGKELLTLSGHSTSVESVAWSPDGRRLASASDIVRIYVMDIRDLMALARERVTAHPSTEGCKKYLHVDKCPAAPALVWW